MTKKLSKKNVDRLTRSLKVVKVEKDVENAWRELFSSYYSDAESKKNGSPIMSPYDTDGYIEVSNEMLNPLRILLEFKFKTNLNKLSDRVRITAQCIHYLRKFSKEKEAVIPNIIVGADEDQAFVLYVPNFLKYLDRDYNWESSPSSAWKDDPKLVNDLTKDKNMSVWVYTIDADNSSQRFDNVKSLFEEIKYLVEQPEDRSYKVQVTDVNMDELFSNFEKASFVDPKSVKTRTAVNIFMQTMIGNNQDYYLVPNNPNQLHIPGDKKISVNGSAIQAYFKHFDRNIKPSEKDKMFAIADRLIEDHSRRNKGDFWTPTIWANEANKMIEDVVGADYKEKSIVWDSASGTKNLTRDFKYSKLYSSTFFDEEINMSTKYNPNSVSFQYDFLNDDFYINNKEHGEYKTPVNTPNSDDWKMPDELFNDLINSGNKPIIFYTNPPYATANDLHANGKHKSGIAKNFVNDYMKIKKNGKSEYGNASQQLYAQFMVRMLKIIEDFNLKNVYIALFTNARFMSGGDYFRKFNGKFFSKFKFQKGCLLNAGEFADTSDQWPIMFSIYKLRSNYLDESIAENQKHEFEVKETKWENDNLSIRKYTKKIMETVYKEDALNYWAKETLKKHPEFSDTYPQLGKAMEESSGKSPRGKLYEGSLGFMVNNSNNIGKGTYQGGVYIFTSSAYESNGFNVMPENFDRAVVNFAARRTIAPNWITAQDNYKKPNVSDPIYSEFVNDSLIMSLFDNQSYQAAYRNWNDFNNIKGYKNRWANQWFWLDKEWIKNKADEKNSPVVFDDIRDDSDRFVAKEIKKRKFSEEASDVIMLSQMLYEEQLSSRQSSIIDLPQLSLEAWDIGWYQMKQINNIFPSKTMDWLKEKISKLKLKCEKNVYELNMLIK